MSRMMPFFRMFMFFLLPLDILSWPCSTSPWSNVRFENSVTGIPWYSYLVRLLPWIWCRLTPTEKLSRQSSPISCKKIPSRRHGLICCAISFSRDWSFMKQAKIQGMSSLTRRVDYFIRQPRQFLNPNSATCVGRYTEAADLLELGFSALKVQNRGMRDICKFKTTQPLTIHFDRCDTNSGKFTLALECC